MASIDVAARLRFHEIDEDVRAALRELQPLIRATLPGILDEFYAHVRIWPEAASRFSDPSRMTVAAGRQLEHWMKIASGDFGTDYVRSAERIGEVHARLGLEPGWYIGAYSFIASRLVKAVAAETKGAWFSGATAARSQARLVNALNKAVLLDMELALTTIQTHAQRARAEELHGLADNFEEHVQRVVEAVAGSAEKVSLASKAMAATAHSTEQRSTAVAAAAEEATANVTVVAASTEEMGASVRQIADQVAQSAKMAGEAVGRAQATEETIERLSNAAEKIGRIVSLISDIAEQTNLLALNATIESARAGEAGKGFAVVAAEVKALANQTAKATEDIGRQINDMQAITKQSVDAIALIRSSIDEINAISTAVNTAVEQQSAATQEIARSTQEAAMGTQDVSSNIAGVLEDAQKTGASSNEVVSASEELGRRAEQLRLEVSKFLDSVRAA